MKTILAPIDFSSITRRVVAVAAAMAAGLGGRVVLLNVIQPPVFVPEYAGRMPNVGTLVDVAAKAARKRLERLSKTLGADGIVTEVLQLAGFPAPTILEQVEMLPADYVVIGSHGHSALYEFVLGSTTSGVLKHAGCPVVVVPSSRKRRRGSSRPGARAKTEAIIA